MLDFFSLIAFIFVVGICAYLILSILGYLINTYNKWSKNTNTVSNPSIQTNSASNFPVFTYIDDDFFNHFLPPFSYKALSFNNNMVCGYPIIWGVPILDELGLDTFNEISLISTRNEYDDMDDVFRDF